MGYKQDWSPRKMDLLPQEAILELEGLAWWNAVQEERNRRGPKGFRQWALRMARPWYRRAKIIKMMAWNDRNSEWNLDRDILRTHHFRGDGSKVTAETVVASLEAMVE